ncbi:MAG: hypothetical protein QOJ29_1027 [Thermoleophilaceae bacterium]|nr:hypothetical protein [Thermoleophilaceae bacterium]
MLGIAAAAAVTVGASAIVGQGVARLSGRRRWVWWAPGVGCCLLLALAGLLIRAPGRASTVLIVSAVVTLAPLLSRDVRTALAEALPDGLPVAAITLLATLLPFAVSGRSGILGSGVNNDMSAHLTTAWWLEHKLGGAGVGAVGGALPDVGYPLGPHGLADALALASHISLVHAFDSVIVVAAPLIALVSLGALQPLRRSVRIAAAVFVAVSYLTVAYIAQAAFKETLEALALITAVLVTAWIVRAEDLDWRAGLPLGVVLGGALHIYSYPGLAWPLGAAGLVVLAHAAWRPIAHVAPGAALAAVVLIAPAAGQIADFYNSPFAGENHDGNLVHALAPIEATGIWLNADFRFYPHPLWPSLALGSLAVVALIVAIMRLLADRRRALPAGLAVAVGVYLYTVATKSIYVSAKALAVLAPLLALTLATGLLLPEAGRARRLRAGLGLVVGAAALASSLLALRDAHVGPTAHEQELATLRPRLGHQPTLFLGKDDFAQWELHGTNLAVARLLYAPALVRTRPSKPVGTSDQLDFDNFLPETLDRFRYVITGGSPYQSTPPGNFRAVARTHSYVVWERHGHTPLRYPVDPRGAPAAVLDCASALGKLRLGGAGPHGTAGVLPRPVLAGKSDWHGQPRSAGESATLTVRLPRGHWDVSLQYVSTTGLDIRTRGVRTTLPATLDRLGPYYRAGTISVTRVTPVTLSVSAKPMSAIGRLLAAPGTTRALNSVDYLPLDGVAFTRHGVRERVMPVRSACGRYVDWVAPPARAGS